MALLTELAAKWKCYSTGKSDQNALRIIGMGCPAVLRPSFHCGANGPFADRFVVEHCPQPGLSPGTAKFWRRGLQPGRRMQAAFVVGEVEVSQFSDEMIGNCPPLLSEQKNREVNRSDLRSGTAPQNTPETEEAAASGGVDGLATRTPRAARAAVPRTAAHHPEGESSG